MIGVCEKNTNILNLLNYKQSLSNNYQHVVKGDVSALWNSIKKWRFTMCLHHVSQRVNILTVLTVGRKQCFWFKY